MRSERRMWGAVLLQLVVLGQGRGYGQRGGTEEKVKNFQVGQEGRTRDRWRR